MKHKVATSLLVVVLAYFISSCVPTPEVQYWSAVNGAQNYNISDIRDTSALEKQSPMNQSPPTKVTRAVLEFKDDGTLWDTRQRDEIIKEIAAKKPSTVLIFAHGWNNNADPSQLRSEGASEDLVHFTKLLGDVQKQKEARTLGIYIGWRGRSMKFDIPHYLNLDERRKVARRIGRGSDLRTSLEKMILASREANPSAKVIVIGHSLGGCMMEKAAGSMVAGFSEPASHPSSDPEMLPNLFLLINNAEVAEESQEIITAINNQQSEQHEGDRLLMPWVLNLQSSGDLANAWLNPINGLIHLRFSERTAAFTVRLQTHCLKLAENFEVSSKADPMAVARSPLLEPALFKQTTDGLKLMRFVQRKELARRDCSGYWNLELDKSIVVGHSGLYGENAIGAAISVVQLAQPRSGEAPDEIDSIPDVDFQNNVSISKGRDFLMKSRPPCVVGDMLSLEKQILSIRGETPSELRDDVYTNFDRQLFHGLALRMPHNASNVSLILSELENLPNLKLPDGSSGPLHEPKGPWPGDWRNRYGVRLFTVLQYTHNAGEGTWTEGNRKKLISLFRDNPGLYYCVGAADAASKEKFFEFVNSWLPTDMERLAAGSALPEPPDCGEAGKSH